MPYIHIGVANKNAPFRGALCCDAMQKGDRLADRAGEVTCPMCQKLAPLVAMLRRYRNEVANHKPLHDAADAVLAPYK